MGWLETQIDNILSWKTRFSKWVYDWHQWLKERMEHIALDVEELVTLVNRIPDMVNNAIGDACIDVLSHVYDKYVKPLSYYVDSRIMDVRGWIEDIYDVLTEIRNDLSTLLGFISKIDDIIDERIDSYKDMIVSWIEDKFIYIVERVLEQEIKR